MLAKGAPSKKMPGFIILLSKDTVLIPQQEAVSTEQIQLTDRSCLECKQSLMLIDVQTRLVCVESLTGTTRSLPEVPPWPDHVTTLIAFCKVHEKTTSPTIRLR